MKHTFLYILLLACAMLNVRCTEGENGFEFTIDDLDEASYKSYWYYSYGAAAVITHETMGMQKAEEFTPYTVADRGDTLFVANVGTAGNSLIVFDKKTNAPLRTIKNWKFNGQDKSFGSWIEAIVPTADRLYVSERQSRIHVFTLPDLEYLSCIGNGAWQGPVFQAQAVAVTDGLIFARNKNGRIRVYKESDVTAANYQKIGYYKETGPGAGNSSNEKFATHYMEVDPQGRILLTGYEAKSIRVLDPSLINDDFKNGTNIDIAEQTWTLPFQPKTFARSSDRMYATGNNDAVSIYDNAQKQWIKTLKSVKGFAFSRPERIYGESDEIFWVSDINKRALVKMGVFKGEIREYEIAGKNIVRVQSALTRSGEETGEFYVDLRTHEIIDPADAE